MQVLRKLVVPVLVAICCLVSIVPYALGGIGAAAAQGVPGSWQPAPPPGGFRVLLFGDFNGSYGSTEYPAGVARVLAQVPEWHVNLVIMPGDLIAGQDRSLPDGRFAEMWAAFDRSVAAPLRASGIPYAAAIGNHDGSGLRSQGSYVFARERDAAAAYWRQPMYEGNLAYLDRADLPFNYSFIAGPLFVAVWDASSAMIPDGALAWLERQLATPAARGASHRWLVGHLPLVGVAQGRAQAGEVIPDGADLAARLANLGIDTYVSGHQAAWYPGTLAGLELAMTGGIGARPLLAGGAPPRSTVTLVDLWLDGTVRYTAYDVGTGQVVTATDLPARIDGYGGTVLLSPWVRD